MRGAAAVIVIAPLFRKKHMEKEELTELQVQRLLAEMLNDSPIPVVIAGETYHVTALKLGVMNLIAEETCRIQEAKEGNMVDIFNQFAKCVPAVIRCIVFAVLNDKDRIFSDYGRRIYSDEYNTLYEKLEWESDRSDWIPILLEIVRRIDINFFQTASSTLTMIRDASLRTRKTTDAPM